MQFGQEIQIPKWILQALNHLYEIERRSMQAPSLGLQRSIDRLKEDFEAGNMFYEDPMGQEFNETRTDLEASITGASTADLVVVEVIKPIIRYGERALSRVVQKGIVVVRSESKGD